MSQPKTVAPKKSKVEDAYIPPVYCFSFSYHHSFAEVDPEEKKKERLNKFYDTEVVMEPKENMMFRQT